MLRRWSFVVLFAMLAPLARAEEKKPGKVRVLLLGDSTVIGSTYSVNPTFDVNVLSTQEFMKGFLDPVSPEQIASFLEQGWPPELLFHLFVFRVDLDKGSSLENHPRWDDAANAELMAFSWWVTNFASRHPRVVSCEPESENVGPALSLTHTTHLKDLVAAGGTDFSLTASDSGYQLRRSKPKGTFRIVAGDATLPCAMTGRGLPSPSSDAIRALAGQGANPRQFTLHIRSPEAILYYLGQLVRLQLARNVTFQVLSTKDYGTDKDEVYHIAPLFVAFRGTVPAGSREASPTCDRGGVVATDVDGETFMIPRATLPPPNPRTKKKAELPALASFEGSAADWERIPAGTLLSPGRSCSEYGSAYDVLTILTQLIALHKSAKDTPTTPLIRSIGP